LNQPLQVADAAQHRLCPGADGLQREPHQQRHQQRLQHLALGQRGEQRPRDDSEQEVRGALRLAGRLPLPGPAQRLGQLQPAARLDQVADHQPDRQGHGRHHQEVSQGQAADPAHARRPPHRPEAEHDRAEDDRADHHLDQVHEPGAERPQFPCEGRKHGPDHDPDQHGDDHGDIQVGLASGDALAAIFVPSTATTPSLPSPALAHNANTWSNKALERLLVLGPEPGDRGVVGRVLRADHPVGHVHLAEGLDPPAGPGPGAVGVHQPAASAGRRRPHPAQAPGG
jgi:hypothetical protein